MPFHMPIELLFIGLPVHTDVILPVLVLRRRRSCPKLQLKGGIPMGGSYCRIDTVLNLGQ